MWSPWSWPGLEIGQQGLHGAELLKSVVYGTLVAPVSESNGARYFRDSQSRQVRQKLQKIHQALITAKGSTAPVACVNDAGKIGVLVTQRDELLEALRRHLQHLANLAEGVCLKLVPRGRCHADRHEIDVPSRRVEPSRIWVVLPRCCFTDDVVIARLAIVLRVRRAFGCVLH